MYSLPLALRKYMSPLLPNTVATSFPPMHSPSPYLFPAGIPSDTVDGRRRRTCPGDMVVGRRRGTTWLKRGGLPSRCGAEAGVGLAQTQGRAGRRGGLPGWRVVDAEDVLAQARGSARRDGAWRPRSSACAGGCSSIW
jgi:hypothetical protein